MAKADTARRLLFVFLLSLGLSYLAFLVLAFFKTHSGFLMQFIFLLDTLRYDPQNLTNLLFSFEFLLNFGSGLILIYLFILLTGSISYALKKYQATRKSLDHLRLQASSGCYSVFNSSLHQTFTSGLFHPRIYLSQKVLRLPTSELLAVLYHEYHHLRTYDPLKSFLVDLVRHFLPLFPAKNYLFGYYDSLVEISADLYAESQLNTRLPLVSALTKFAAPSFGLQSFFSAQSHRLRHLVGEQRLTLAPLFTFNTSLILVLILFSAYLSKTDVFYECRHLLECFRSTLTAPHSVMTSIPPLTPDHCAGF